jgi:hypothetical protein
LPKPKLLLAQQEGLDAWGTKRSPELLAKIDKIRWDLRDPACDLVIA